MNDWPPWEERFLRGPCGHHCTGVHGHAAPVLYGAWRFLGVEPEWVDPTESDPVLAAAGTGGLR